MGEFGPSERVGLVWLRLMLPDLIGEVVDGARVIFLDPSCGDAYDERISYARIGADDSCPLLKLVRLDETGEGEGDGDHEVDWNRWG